MSHAALAPTRLAVALTLILSTLPAFASQQDDPRHAEIKDLDELVVRATPLPQTAETLTRPVEVLAGSRLDEVRAATLGETVGRLPGVQSSYFGPGVGRPIIRGMEGARVQVLGDGLASGDVSTVSVDHAVSIEPFLADQIEVLKGPSTLLYGSGAIGGAVNVVEGRIPEHATDAPLQGRAELRAASGNDERTGMLRLDGTSSSGNLVFHIDALHRETGDYAIPGDAGRADDHDDHDDDHHDIRRGRLANSAVRTDSAALGVSWVGERGFLGVGASLFNSRYGVPGHSHPAGDDHDDHDHDHDHDGHGGHGAHDDVRIVMDQRRHELRGGLDRLGAFDSLRVKLARNAYTHTEYEGHEVGTVFDNDSTELRMELVHRDWGGWDGAFGLQGSRRDFRALGDEAFVPDSQTRDAGLFWLGQRSFDALDLEIGARHDRNRIEVAEGAHPDREFDASSLSAAARWHFGHDLHLSLGLDRAQRTPTAEELYSDGLHVATRSYEFGDPQLRRETANRVELGLHWHRGPLTLGASLYAVDYRDFIYLADTGIGGEGVAVRAWNQADARFTGGELDLRWTLLDDDSGRWTLRGFGDVVRGRLVDDGTREVALAVPHGDHAHHYTAQLALSGNLPRIAPWRVGTELGWEGGPWRASLGAIHHARQDRVAAYEAPSAGYTLVNAHLSWHLDTAGGNALELFVDGRNLLDREARPHTSFLREYAPLPGRSVAAGVRLFF